MTEVGGGVGVGVGDGVGDGVGVGVGVCALVESVSGTVCALVKSDKISTESEESEEAKDSAIRRDRLGSLLTCWRAAGGQPKEMLLMTMTPTSAILKVSPLLKSNVATLDVCPAPAVASSRLLR